jgi:uncharacterized membrane protein
MMTRRKFTTIALASAAAAMFATAPVSTVNAAENAQVKCFGVNQCAGQNDCKTANNACKGHGSCKGQGFLNMSKEQCDKMGGSVGKPK